MLFRHRIETTSNQQDFRLGLLHKVYMLRYSDYVFFITSWTLPLIIGLYLITRLWKNDVAKCISLLILRPVFSILLILLELNYDLLDKLSTFYSYEIVRNVLWVVPELILTLIVVYSFRNLLANNKLVRLFFILDTIRWLSVFIAMLFTDLGPEPDFYWQIYLAGFFISIFPSLYALGGLVAMNRPANSKNATIN